jgi:hypothetical protein
MCGFMPVLTTFALCGFGLWFISYAARGNISSALLNRWNLARTGFDHPQEEIHSPLNDCWLW